MQGGGCTIKRGWGGAKHNGENSSIEGESDN